MPGPPAHAASEAPVTKDTTSANGTAFVARSGPQLSRRTENTATAMAAHATTNDSRNTPTTSTCSTVKSSSKDAKTYGGPTYSGPVAWIVVVIGVLLLVCRGVGWRRRNRSDRSV